jgi:hypothetical protein
MKLCASSFLIGPQYDGSRTRWSVTRGEDASGPSGSRWRDVAGSLKDLVEALGRPLPVHAGIARRSLDTFSAPTGSRRGTGSAPGVARGQPRPRASFTAAFCSQTDRDLPYYRMIQGEYCGQAACLEGALRIDTGNPQFWLRSVLKENPNAMS